ncbi:MAG: hypothetical protein ACK4X1_01225 [Terricaulis sp.]
MKFTLTYDGLLPSNGDSAEKSAIRSHIHPQLLELWNISPVLSTVRTNRMYPIGRGAVVPTEKHHSEGRTAMPTSTQTGSFKSWQKPELDMCAPITVGNCEFIPLVRESLALKCALRILFMRKEEPGGIVNRGDIDNRLKTLLDALSMPNIDQEKRCPTRDMPTYTLLENDRDIVAIDIDTRQLLSRPGSHRNEVRLIIDVDVRVAEARSYNQPFLGG